MFRTNYKYVSKAIFITTYTLSTGVYSAQRYKTNRTREASEGTTVRTIFGEILRYVYYIYYVYYVIRTHHYRL